MNDVFRQFATTASKITGSVWSFVLAVSLIVMWASTGPLFNFSTNWQLFINSLTTIITFLMVFLIQNTQNRDSKAIHLKLDELVRAMKGARLHYIESEDLTDKEIDDLLTEFKGMGRKKLPKKSDK